MPADEQNYSTDRILNLKRENTGDVRPIKKSKTQETRFQCVVCQQTKTSLSELHWHQTYQHSTEELSLSVIGWKGLVKIIAPPLPQEKENSGSLTNQRSIYNSFSKKPSQFYYLSSSILRVKDNKIDNSDVPIDCTLPVAKVEAVKEEPSQSDDQALVEPKMEVDSNINDKWKEELSLIKEITMEDFIKSANQLCSELEDYKRLCVLKKAIKKKPIL
ncbi:uncharacterized protein LOC131667140 [Phymastichus coffea]|uniref:uncharacterized protein LOC131667140 n=1 Tax=Phymastichus coffea TaxID=108790 RepID=UPI00273CC044|nr:uncharacterized protein LOC131667140 [Phymastichus coffea]